LKNDFTYNSPVVTLNGDNTLLFVSPNPARNILHVYTSAVSAFDLIIIDAKGTTLLHKAKWRNNMPFDISFLPSGAYIVVARLENGNQLRQTIIKQ